MAEVAAPTRPTGEPRSTGDRGSLEVADRVVEKVAGQAARSVPGVATTSGGLGPLGRGYPRATATGSGLRTTLVVEIALAWPAPAARTAAAVRDEVTRSVERYAGVRADAVDVVVASVDDTAPVRRRVR